MTEPTALVCLSSVWASAQPPARPQPAPWRIRPRSSAHSPGALVVKKEDKEELLASLGLFLLSQLQHIQRRHRDGDAIVQQALPRHLGVDDLRWEGAGTQLGVCGVSRAALTPPQSSAGLGRPHPRDEGLTSSMTAVPQMEILTISRSLSQSLAPPNRSVL